MIEFKVKKTTEECIPTKAHPSDAGWDLYAAQDKNLFPRDRILIDCGFKMELPDGYEAQIRPRSGLANKHGITVLNSPGTIDAHYRGPVKVMLINHSYDYHRIQKGDRIAQMVIKQVEQSRFEIVDELTDTDRGAGGFGSSGR